MNRTVAVNLAAVGTIGLVLAGDSVATRLEQNVLGVLVTAILLFQLRWADREERAIVLWCVGISTAMELFCTQVWHLYGYRFGNLPLYVPPGHGLLCLAALWTAKSQAMTRHRRLWVGAIVGMALFWSTLGLTIGDTLDVEGAAYLPLWIPLVLFTRRSLEWCWTFVLASLVELCGTWMGTWEWASVQPWLGFPCANPPSAAAGGYCLFTWMALGCVYLQRNYGGDQPRRPSVASTTAFLIASSSERMSTFGLSKPKR